MLRWPAALASLLLPGIGHALAGAPLRAVVIAALAFACQALFLAAQTAPEITPLLLSLAGVWLVLVAAATIAVAVDAFRIARHAVPIRQRGGPRALILPVAAAAGLNLALLGVPDTIPAWRGYSIPSASMLPTLRPGDRLIVQEGWYEAHPPARGEIAVFTLAPDADAYIKRIAGLPGDRLRMQSGFLYINDIQVIAVPLPGGRQAWTYPGGPTVEVLKHGIAGRGDTTEEFLIPAGHVFMLGDNLDDSHDSRLNPRMRFVPRAALRGRAAILYWPPARFGLPVR
jgi:signal peptidase I